MVEPKFPKTLTPGPLLARRHGLSPVNASHLAPFASCQLLWSLAMSHLTWPNSLPLDDKTYRYTGPKYDVFKVGDRTPGYFTVRYSLNPCESKAVAPYQSILLWESLFGPRRVARNMDSTHHHRHRFVVVWLNLLLDASIATWHNDRYDHPAVCKNRASTTSKVW